MKKILLANIGNRNVSIENTSGYFVSIDKYISESRLEKYLEVNERNLSEKVLFREFTKDTWGKIEQGIPIPQLQLEILTPKVIEEDTYDKVVIFFTRQEDGNFNHQDTIYEALIIKYELQKRKSELEVELLGLNCNPTDENSLYLEYSAFAKLLISNNPGASFAYLDAGGTTQMKFASKMVFDYYLKQNQSNLQIRYITYLDDYSKDVERRLFHRYYALNLASEFVSAYNFHAANQTLSRIDYSEENIKSIILHTDIAANRLAFNSRNRWHSYLSGGVSLQTWADGYIRKKAPQGFLNFPELSSAKADLFEFASICQHYFAIENYTLGVATYYRLCEEISKIFAEKVSGLDLDNEGLRKRFVSQSQQTVDTFLQANGSQKYGIPYLIAFGLGNSASKRLSINTLFDCIRPTISHINSSQSGKGINILRNRCWLAHNSISIDKKDLDAEVPEFCERHLPKIFKVMGMPQKNIFEEMRSSLLDMFKS